MATTTNLGTVMSVRTLERTIGRLLISPYPEVRALAELLTGACQQPPDATWPELTGQAIAAEALAPTLARHAHPQEYAAGVRERARKALESLPLSACGLVGDGLWREGAGNRIDGGLDRSRAVVGGWREGAGNAGAVDLLPRHDLSEEILATLLYRESRHPYRTILGAVQSLEPEEQATMLAEILGRPGKHDEPPRELRAGHPFVFDIEMDWGGFRDLHRHRRCEQVVQAIDLDAGCRLPPETADPNSLDAIRTAYEAAVAVARTIARDAPLAAHYLLPFAHKVRCLFKMDFAEVQYVTRLRSGPKGHDSYRAIAWAMAQAARKAHPQLDPYVEATPPSQKEPLVR